MAKEYTFISLVQLTSVVKGDECFEPFDKDTIASNIKVLLEERTNVFDNIQVVGVQQFEMELSHED